MDPVLVQIDSVLDGQDIFQLIKIDMARRYPNTQRTGRTSTPIAVILRMLAVKRLYNLSYQRTEYHVKDSLVLRRF